MSILFWKKVAVLVAVAAGGFAAGHHVALIRNGLSRAGSAADRDVAVGAQASAAAGSALVANGHASRTSPRASEARAALQEIETKPPSEQREQERLRLIQALAASDPSQAIEYAKQHLKRDRLAQAMSGIATEWARHDPEAAWGWARSLGVEESYHAHTVMEQVSRDDASRAARFAAEFAQQQPHEAVAMTLTAMRGMTEAGNFDGARRLAGEMPLSSIEDRGVLLNFMAGQWARHEPEKTAQWVQSLPEGTLRNQALIGLGESWGEVDPPKAADFAAKLPPGAQRQLALKQAIANWIVTDPAKASSWVDSFEPSADFDQAVASVATIRFLMEERVDIALSWANSIYNEPLKLAALSEILSHWSVRDRAAATNYVKTLAGVPSEARQQLLKQLQPSGD
jgi:hypothetical protein